MMNPYSESELRKALKNNENTFILMPIMREEIESQDVSRVEDFIKTMTKIGKPLRQKCGLSVSGYDHIPTELFEIQDVRKFIAKLFRRNPFLMYYIDVKTGFHEWLLSTLADSVTALRREEHLGKNVYEVLELYGINPPQFQVHLTFNGERFSEMMEGIRKHGIKIGDKEGANAIASVLELQFKR